MPKGKFPFQDYYRKTDEVPAWARTQLQHVLTDAYTPEEGTQLYVLQLVSNASQTYTQTTKCL